MSVYITGMEMPTSCYDCDFAYQDQDSEHNVYWTCAAVHKAACMHERRDDCPLVPVPEHGRLVDADKLVNKYFGKDYLEKAMTANKDEMGTALVNIPLIINNAPTVIPASKEN